MNKHVKKLNTVSEKRFRTWENHEDFDIDVDDEGNVAKLRCKVCTNHINVIRAEGKRRSMRGNVLKGVLNFVDGVSGTHKSNVLRHTKADGLHDWAKKRYITGGASNSTLGVPVEREKKQRSMQEVTLNNPVVKENYKRLFVTALHIAMTEKPLADFSNLIDLQKKNGLKFFEGKTHDKACAKFIEEMAKVLRNDLEQILKSVNFFSISMDGSQPRKTGHEKELLYTKVVIRGQAVSLLLKCINMDDYGSDAADLKRAIDETITSDYSAGNEYVNQLVSVCANGTSVNMGIYNGTVTKIKETRPWLLDIHCSNHRLELAIQGAFEEDVAFSKIDDLLLQLYELTKNSGKVKRLLKATAMRLDVISVNYIKSSGTRFQNHKYRAIKSLIINYIPMSELMENYLEPGSRLGTAAVIAKMRGWLKLFREFKCLASLQFYYKTLQQTAHLAYLMQKNDVLITDIKDALGDAVEKLRDIRNDETELPFESECNEDGDIIIKVEATNLPATQRFKEKNKLSAKEQKRVEKSLKVHRKEYKIKNAVAGRQKIKKIKDTLLPAIIDHINCRFASFVAPIYENIARIIDHHRWDFADLSAEKKHIKDVADHFSTPLKQHSFNQDLAVQEFKALKKLVKSRFHHLGAAAMWQSVISKYHATYRNILLIVELILCIMWASSVVERGFSTASRLCVPSRRSLGKNTINDLLMLRVNLPVLKSLDENYEEKLIKKAVENYVPGKYHHTKSTASTAKPIQATSVQSEDLFLPIQRKDIVNGLLDDDEYLTISDDDESLVDEETYLISGDEDMSDISSNDEQDNSFKLPDDPERPSSHSDVEKSDIEKSDIEISDIEISDIKMSENNNSDEELD